MLDSRRAKSLAMHANCSSYSSFLIHFAMVAYLKSRGFPLARKLSAYFYCQLTSWSSFCSKLTHCLLSAKSVISYSLKKLYFRSKWNRRSP